MAERKYDHLDQDALIFLVQYIMTKLKNSPLSKDTKYTLNMNSKNELELKDASGTIISTVPQAVYKDVTAEASGLMTPDLLSKLSTAITKAQMDTYVGNTCYTKEETSSAIATAIANSEHLKRKVVEALPPVESADANTIYMVKKDGTESDNHDEYMLIGGAFEKIGDSKVDMTGYVKNEDLTNFSNDQITKIVDDAYGAVFGS